MSKTGVVDWAIAASGDALRKSRPYLTAGIEEAAQMGGSASILPILGENGSLGRNAILRDSFEAGVCAVGNDGIEALLDWEAIG